jgi:hypothetical protein
MGVVMAVGAVLEEEVVVVVDSQEEEVFRVVVDQVEDGNKNMLR